MKKFFAFVMLLAVVATMLVSCGGGEVDVGTVITYYAATQEEIYEYTANLDSEVYEVIRISYYQKTFFGTPTYYVEYREKEVTNAESEQELATEHSHTWDVKEVAGTIVSFCTECGKLAE